MERNSLIDTLSLMKSLPFFAHFDKNSLEYLNSKSIKEHFTINNFVFKQANSADYLYIVESGEFEVVRLTGN